MPQLNAAQVHLIKTGDSVAASPVSYLSMFQNMRPLWLKTGGNHKAPPSSVCSQWTRRPRPQTGFTLSGWLAVYPNTPGKNVRGLYVSDHYRGWLLPIILYLSLENLMVIGGSRLWRGGKETFYQQIRNGRVILLLLIMGTASGPTPILVNCPVLFNLFSELMGNWTHITPSADNESEQYSVLISLRVVRRWCWRRCHVGSRRRSWTRSC